MRNANSRHYSTRHVETPLGAFANDLPHRTSIVAVAHKVDQNGASAASSSGTRGQAKLLRTQLPLDDGAQRETWPKSIEVPASDNFRNMIKSAMLCFCVLMVQASARAQCKPSNLGAPARPLNWSRVIQPHRNASEAV